MTAIPRAETRAETERRKAKRFKKAENATTVSRKALLIAERTSRRLDAPALLAEVAEGVVYADGVREKRGTKKAARRMISLTHPLT